MPTTLFCTAITQSNLGMRGNNGFQICVICVGLALEKETLFFFYPASPALFFFFFLYHPSHLPWTSLKFWLPLRRPVRRLRYRRIYGCQDSHVVGDQARMHFQGPALHSTLLTIFFFLVDGYMPTLKQQCSIHPHTQHPSTRAAADQVLINFKQSPNILPACQYILGKGPCPFRLCSTD